MKIKTLLISSLLLMNVLHSVAQKALKLALKKGEKFYVEKTVNMDMKIETPQGNIEIPINNILGITYEVLSDNSGTNDIKMTFSSIKFKSKSPMTNKDLSFDSQKKEDMDGDIGVKVKKSIAQNYIFTIDANTQKITSINSRPKLEHIDPAQEPEPMVQLFPQNDGELRTAVAEIFGGDIPENASPVAGYSWNNSDTTIRDGINTITSTAYTINDVKNNTINVSLTGKSSTEGTSSIHEMEVKQSGSSTNSGSEMMDATTGLLIEKKVTDTSIRNIKMAMGSQKMNNTTTQSTTLKKIQ